MKKEEFIQEFQGGDFRMSNDVDSMTNEEIKQDITKKTEAAKKGVDEFRRQVIENSLMARGIDPETVDIEKTLETNEIVFKKKIVYSDSINQMLEEDTDKFLGNDFRGYNK